MNLPAARHLSLRTPLLLLLLAGVQLSCLAQAPAAPPSQPDAPAGIASITGFIVDRDGSSIPGAHLTLSSDGQTAAATSSPSPTTITANDGSFTLANVSAGHFILSIAAPGFASKQLSGELQPGETRDLSEIALDAGSTTDVQVTATQTEIAEAQINQEEKQRVLGVFPNFYVSYIPNPVPLDPKQKFELALRTLIDPVSFALNGLVAGIEQADNAYAWGQGAQGYGKRYAANYGTFMTGDLIGSAILPIVFKQDPRYFYKGTGSTQSRALYAIAQSVICKGDNHHWQVNYSAILGGLAASGISNAYYPAPNRTGVGLTFEGAAIGTGFSAVSNLIQEFIVRKLTPHIPPNQPATPPSPPAKP